jgi:hypothetical protein
MSGQKSGGNRKIILAAAGLLVAAAVLLVVGRLAAPKGSAGTKSILVEVIHKDGSSKSYPLNTDQAYLGAALVEGGVVEDNQGPYGLYILTADGETADESAQEWWKVTKSGEMVNTGADATPIADGDRYELTLTVGYDA